MDSTRGRKPDGKSQPGKQLIFDDYQPSIKWSQDADNHLLHVDLPGFKREEIKVQVDNSGKLAVTGRRQASEGRYVRLEQAFDIPKDSILDKVSGKFEDGTLFLIMPKKKVAEAKEAPQKAAPPAQELTKAEDPIKREKPNIGGGDEELRKREEDPMKLNPKRDEEKKKEEDPIKREKAKRGGDEDKKRVKDPILKGKLNPKIDEKNYKEEAPDKREKAKISSGEEEKKKDEDPILEEKPKRDEAEKRTLEGPKGTSGDGDNRVDEKVGKKGMAWKKREGNVEEDEGCLHYGLVDVVLGKINRNRRVIAVAVVAFSIGFIVSQKLRSSGR